jgi:hypothetical protein
VTIVMNSFVDSCRTRHMIALIVACLMSVVGFAKVEAGQSTGATLSGTVVDTTGAVLQGAQVSMRNNDTGVVRQVTSSADGAFSLVEVLPGRYTISAELDSFARSELRDIVLNVNDRTTVRVVMNLASLGEATTVVADVQRVNTSPAVSTVVDRQFVENLPLNGRSLQSLLELTPGVVLTSGGSGFSVNGQRPTSNYFTVDGTSANVQIASGPTGAMPGAGGSGQLPGLTALGSTSGMVGVDSLEEFRIQTSGYAPEFGRMVGGQVSLVTRSGTNRLHGSVFEYFRHDALDATDWFVNSRGQPKAELRQHDFGGTVGGPLLRDRMFFFGSFEGLRLKQPQAQLLSVVSPEARRTAIPALKPYLDAIPLPNGRDLGNGVGELVASWSDPSQVDASSVKVDYNLKSMRVWGRWNHAPSYSGTRSGGSGSTLFKTHQDSDGLTLGTTWTITPRLIHDIRVSYSANHAPYTVEVDNFGGAIPPPASVFESGGTPENTLYSFSVTGAGNWLWGSGAAYKQRQMNVVESATLMTGAHELKAGLDFRRLNPQIAGGTEMRQGLFFTVPDLPLGRARNYSQSINFDQGERAFAFNTLGVYLQDTWRLQRRLTLTYGLRWDVVPPPTATQGPAAVTVDGLDDPYGGRVQIAPRGTPLWNTQYGNVAPRVGVSYMISEQSGRQLVLRGGFGTFYDTGYGHVANSFVAYPYTGVRNVNTPVFPLTADTLTPPSRDAARPGEMYLMDPQLEVPLTYQWNISAEQALGAKSSLTIGYVGAAGRELLKSERYTVTLVEWPGTTTGLTVNRSGGYSNYHGLQAQYQRRLHRGLQALASYTFGTSKDTASGDGIRTLAVERVPIDVDYGYSDFDVRHNMTAAITYQYDGRGAGGFVDRLLGGWGIDLMLRARTGFPVQVFAIVPFPPETEAARPNVVSGQPFWIEDGTAPGGRRLNSNAFRVPSANTQGDLPRGAIRGFNAKQADIALRRQFGLAKSVRVQLRFEVFNVTNTPNFGTVQGDLSNALFGLSSRTLNRSLSGLNAMYQIGGARSSQLGVKLLF